MIYGVLRVLFGLALLQVVGTPLVDIIHSLMAHELRDDPSDLLFGMTQSIIGSEPATITYFIAFYFIFWGVTDTVLSYCLLKDKLWAFPVSLVLIGCFVLYELVRLFYTQSAMLASVIAIDLFIFWLIWREYRKLLARQSIAAEPREV